RGKSRCIFCGVDNISDDQLRDQSRHHGIGTQLMTVVVEGTNARVYLSPNHVDVSNVTAEDSEWLDQDLPDNARWFSPPAYGLRTYADLFTPRQLVALTTF